MKTNKVKAFLLALVALAAFAAPVTAQDPTVGTAVSITVADDQAPAAYFKYVGTSGKGYVTVAANGDLTFEDVDSSTVTTTFECPVSGALGGVIDVSDTACDTFGEVCDIINTSTSTWRCVLHAALRTDSSNDALVAASDQVATGPAGYGALFDTDVFLSQRAVIMPTAVPPSYALSRYLTSNSPDSKILIRNPWELNVAMVSSVYTLSTYGSGTSTLKVWSVAQTQALAGSGQAETVTTLWSEAAGATTVAKQFGICDTPATACSPAWGTELWALPGQKLVVSLENSAAMATTALTARGKLFYIR